MFFSCLRMFKYEQKNTDWEKDFFYTENKGI